MTVRVICECDRESEHRGIPEDHHPKEWEREGIVEDREWRQLLGRLEEGQSRYLVHVEGADCPTCGHSPTKTRVEGFDSDDVAVVLS